MTLLDQVYFKMVQYYHGQPSFIQHFVKVHSFAAVIGRGEGLDERTQLILEVAALVHDIGIKPAMEKYGSSAGPLQEKEGEPAARELLSSLDVDLGLVDRVAYLVAHHHTYTDVDGIDYRILLEADYLVNCFEGEKSKEASVAAMNHFFSTDTGTMLLKTMLDLE